MGGGAGGRSGPLAAGISGLMEKLCSLVSSNCFCTNPELPDCPTCKEKPAACIFIWKPQLLENGSIGGKKEDITPLRLTKTQL